MHIPARSGLHSFLKIALSSIAFALVATVPEASTASEGRAPEWRSFSDPTLGLQVDISAKTRVSYRNLREFGHAVTVAEQDRTGEKTTERSSRFQFEVQEFFGFAIQAGNGYQDAQSKVQWDSSRERRILKQQLMRHQGLVWREFVFSYPAAQAGEPVTTRVIMGKHHERVYTFTWSWYDAGPMPADAQRIFDSIRISEATRDENASTRADLEDAIRDYWLGDGKMRPCASKFLKRADQNRRTASEVIRGFGPIVNTEFKGSKDDWTLFRIEHEHAVVDWRIAEDKGVIVDVDWKKVRDL